MRRARFVVVGSMFAVSLSWLACSKDNAPPPAAPAPVTVQLDGGGDVQQDHLAPSMAEIDAMAKEAQAANVPQPDFFGCGSDADCIAVPKNGCCDNGYKEAVNKAQADAYKASFTCPHPNQMCPHYKVNDQRVPKCGAATKRCEMIDLKHGSPSTP